LPSVNRLYEELKPRGLEVLLVDFRESPSLVKRVVAERGYTAPVLVDETGDTTGRVYGVFAAPTVYLIDRQGRLIARGVGPRDWETPQARQLIRELLAAR
jgi:AhpC/TSA family